MGLFGFLIRIGLAIGLVLATWNPSGTSYVHWVQEAMETGLSVKVLAGVLLLIGYIVCLRATFRSIGIFGVVIVAALLGSIAWVLWDYGILNVEDPGLMQWLALVGLGLILGIGLSWSHVRRAISGQMDVDDVDE